MKNFPRTLNAIRETLMEAKPEEPGIGLSTYEYVHRIKPRIVRELLQEYGTEVRRADKDSYWVDKWLETVGQLKSIQLNGLRVVAPDMRFGNEARAIKSLGGVTFHVARPGYEDTGNHASEVSLVGYKYDVLLNNVGDVQDLTDLVDLWAARTL